MKYPVPKQPLLEAFLRSDQQTYTLPNYFKNIIAARKFIPMTLGVAIKYKLVSVAYAARGEGKTAYVTLTKTKDVYNRRGKIFDEITAERECLISLINIAGAHVISTYANSTKNMMNTNANNNANDSSFSPSTSNRSSMISNTTTIESDTSTSISPTTLSESDVTGILVGMTLKGTEITKTMSKDTCSSSDNDDNSSNNSDDEDVPMKHRKLN